MKQNVVKKEIFKQAIVMSIDLPHTRKIRGGFSTVATSKMERFVIRVKTWKLLTIITKRSILDVAAVLDPPLKVLLQEIPAVHF